MEYLKVVFRVISVPLPKLFIIYMIVNVKYCFSKISKQNFE